MLPCVSFFSEDRVLYLYPDSPGFASMFLLMVLLGVLQTFGKDTLSLGAYYFGSKFLLLFSSDYSRAVGPKRGNSEQRLHPPFQGHLSIFREAIRLGSPCMSHERIRVRRMLN